MLLEANTRAKAHYLTTLLLYLEKTFMGNEVTLYNNEEEQDLSLFNKKSFVERIELASGKQNIVQGGKIAAGTYYIPNKDNPTQLDKSELVYIVGWRNCAKRFVDGGAPLTYTNPKSPEFLAIMEEVGKLQSDEQCDCSWGAEFLMYVASQDKFLALFLKGKSTRPLTAEFTKFIGKVAILDHKVIERKIKDKKTGKLKPLSWIIPQITASNELFEIPSNERIAEAIETWRGNKHIEAEAEAEAGGAETSDTDSR